MYKYQKFLVAIYGLPGGSQACHRLDRIGQQACYLSVRPPVGEPPTARFYVFAFTLAAVHFVLRAYTMPRLNRFRVTIVCQSRMLAPLVDSVHGACYSITMTKNLPTLHAAWEIARDLARSSPTPENREAAKVAWAALDAASPRQKVSGYASSAGKRQHTERKK